MKIVVAKTAGFCMGVRRAVDMVLDASNLAKEPIYTYGPLIHNPQVLQMLEEKKIFRIEKIPEKGAGIVLIRAHGVPPEDEQALKEAGFDVINATCPRVVRVQVIIRRYAKQGYSTIIIGDKRHPEVIGLLGYAKGKGYTVTSLDALDELPKFEKAVVVAQTTQNTSFYEDIKVWCSENAPHYRIFDTICGSTEKRQTEIRQLAVEHDAVVVVGGKQSGNTKRLAQIAAATGKPSFHVEDADELDIERLGSDKSIAITAGASTPNWTISDTVQKIEKNGTKKHILKQIFNLFRDFLLKTNLLVAMGAGCLTFACSTLQGFEKMLHHSAISMFYILSMQILNNLFMIKSDKYNNPARALFYENYKPFLTFFAVCSGGAGLYLSFISGMLSFFILLVMSLLGLSYNLKIIPSGMDGKMPGKIRDIPGSKTILITLAWGTVTCLLPAITNKGSMIMVVIAFVFATGLVFAKTAFFDILAIQGDRITGKETIPILLGEKKSLKIINYVLWVTFFVLLIGFFTGLAANSVFLLALIPLFMLLLIRFFKKDSKLSGVHPEFIMEFNFIAAGLIAAVM